MPQLTDAGAARAERVAEILAARAEEILVKILPSQSTTLVLGGGVFLLGCGWLALMFYKEGRSGHMHHTVEYITPPPPPPPV